MDPDGDGIALFVAMPARHLETAASLGVERLTLPLGRLGDVATAPAGCPVYCVTLDEEGIASPAATWRARFIRWQDADAGPDPGRSSDPLPPSWLEDRAAARAPDASVVDREAHGADGAVGADEDEDEDDQFDEDDDAERPRQVLVVVEDLRPLDRSEWVFGNEVVPKQRRGSRSFVPMTPTLVRLPD